MLYCTTTVLHRLPACLPPHDSIAVAAAFKCDHDRRYFSDPPDPTLTVYFILFYNFILIYKLCRKTIANQNPVPCSVALSNLLYGTTTSIDRHVRGYHIIPDNEPITNSSLKLRKTIT
mgnify:CR=1 FL=1